MIWISNTTDRSYWRSLIGCLSGFTVRLELGAQLLQPVCESRLRVVHRHAITTLILHEGDNSLALITRQLVREVDRLMVAHIKDNLSLSHPWSFCRLFDWYVLPNYWLWSFKFDFCCSNGNRAYWLDSYSIELFHSKIILIHTDSYSCKMRIHTYVSTTEKETGGESSIDMLTEIAEQILSKYWGRCSRFYSLFLHYGQWKENVLSVIRVFFTWKPTEAFR